MSPASRPGVRARAATIRRRGAAERAAGFSGLREQGLAAIRSLCGDTWTDHNLHDPGITILEQLCYALTELIYRAQFPVEDHLCGSDGRLDFEALSLHRPSEIFPCRATTAADLRRVLLDRVPGLDDASLEPLRNAPVQGLFQLRLKLAPDAAESEGERVALARAAYRSQRGLGEDLDETVVVLARRPCHLVAEIEIGGPRDAADVMADVLHVASRVIARTPQRRGVRELLALGRRFEDVFGGPALHHGVLEDDSPRRRTLYVADVAARVRAIDGVKELRRFALRSDDRPPTSGALPWQGDDWALALELPGPGRVPPDVRITRHGHPVEVSAAALAARLRALAAQERTDRTRRRSDDQGGEAAALPRGRSRPAPRYASVQPQFPAIYGLAPHGVPPHEGPMAQARARQLGAYLMLFEQVIAHAHAQVGHLGDLFSIDAGSAQSHWWQMLDDTTLPGLQALYTQPPAQVQREVYEPFDIGAWRKSRALDHLLALYGETYAQNSMRQFGGHLAADELDSRLLQNKAAYLRDVVVLGRDRAGGWDDARPCWNDADNTPGLQRRCALLLGLHQPMARSLTSGLRRLGLTLDETAGPVPDPWQTDTAAAQSAPAAGLDLAPLPAAERDRLARALLAPFRRTLDGAFFRLAVVPRRYRLWQAAAHDWRLALGPDEQGRWWGLGRYAAGDEARRAGGALRQALLALHDDAEGLHVIEHVLLRPTAAGRAPQQALGVTADFHSLQISIVLPAWTVRTHQASFQAFARETLRINTPFHLGLRCLWLPFDAMERFEGAHERWMELRRAWHATPGDATAAQRLDAASAALIQRLHAAPGAGAGA